MLAVVVVVACLFGVGQGYSTGPPPGACSSMMPRHGASPQTSDPPFSVLVSSKVYGKFSSVEVTINRGHFRGIMLQARRRGGSNSSPVGTFEDIPPNMGTLNCGAPDDTFVHTSRVSKGLTTVTWRAPAEAVGEVQFVATIVESKETFWTSVTSDTLKPTEFEEVDGCPLDVAILVDSSGSICNNVIDATTCERWEMTKEFTLMLAEFFLSHDDPRIRSRIAIIRFSRRVFLDVGLLDYTEVTSELREEILNMRYENKWTNTSGALDTARLSVFTPSGGDRPDEFASDIVIIITDGRPRLSDDHTIDQHSVNMALEASQKLKDDGVKVFAIGVTYRTGPDAISDDVLRDISSPPQLINQTYWRTRDFDSLQDMLIEVTDTTCDTSTTTAATTTKTTTTPKTTTTIETTTFTSHGDPQSECTADIVFVMDYSDSLGHAVYQQVAQYVSSFVSKLDLETTSRVGLVTFSDSEILGFHLKEYRNPMAASEAVLGVQYVGGKTNTAAALKFMYESMFTSGNGDRSEVPDVAVVITDGGSNIPDKYTVIEEAREAKKKGIHIIVIGVGDWLGIYELNAIASYPHSTNVIVVPEPEDLPSTEESLRVLVCNENNDCGNKNPCQNGGTCVDGYDMYWCECPAGTAGVNCERACREPADIAFAFDLSGSVGLENAQKEVDFLAELIRRGLNLHDDYSRLALEDFADSANTRFYLDEYSSNRQVLDALDFYYAGGGTNTAGALDEMRTGIYVPGRGDKSSVQNVGILCTDGRSADPEATRTSARLLREADTHLIAVGVGNKLRENELESIASEPTTSNVINVEDFDDLSSSTDALIDLICNNEDDCTGNPCKNGGTCTDLRGGYSCSCTDDFTGNNCERGSSIAIELVFLIDASRGVRRDRFKKVIDFAISITSNLEISSEKTRVAAVTFAEDANVEFQLDTYSTKQDVIAHLKTLLYERGKANTAAALRAMIDDVFADDKVRDDAQQVCIIISNDNSEIDEQLTLPYAIEVKNTGVHMVSVGVGDVRPLEMRGLASRPQSQNVFHAPSWRNLEPIVDDVIDVIFDGVDSCDDDPCANGGDCEDGMGTFVCSCDSDFAGEHCERECSSQMDLVFLLDLSGSVRTVYDIVTMFTQYVIYGVNMDFGRTRIGVVIYSDDADAWVHLDDYNDKEAVLNAITFGSSGGKTDTGGAIRRMRNDVFSSARGDRPGVDNRAVIITDAKSNDESDTEREAERARQDGVEIYVVALGSSPRMSEVNSMASDPNSDHMVSVRSVNDIKEAADQLLDQLCQ